MIQVHLIGFRLYNSQLYPFAFKVGPSIKKDI